MENLYKKSILIAIGLFAAVFLQAQIPVAKNESPKNIDPFSERLCKSFIVSVPVENPDVINGTVAKLKEINPALSGNFTALRLQHDIESPGGRHLTFEQTFYGIPVFHSQVKANLDKQNRIKSVFDNSWNTARWEPLTLKTAADKLHLSAIESFLRSKHTGEKTTTKSRKVIAVIDETPVALAEIELWDDTDNEHLLLLADNALQIFLRRDLNVYGNAEAATALVFIPDPLTTAKQQYGTPYVDDNNNDIPELNNERIPADIDVTLDNGTYRLENARVRMDEFSAPDVQPVTSSSPVFDYTRSQPGFEDVNVFYHLTVYRSYVESLGFANLVNMQLFADAHALNGADQSMFTDHIFGPRLFFGEGGVDDGEDADVIVHENGHALSFAASPNTNTGTERQSVDEALGDYLATSYSLSLDTFRWADMFTWDGHNEYWNGRTATSARTYPADLGTSFHRNGEIYNAALSRILQETGREKADKIVLQSLYYLTAGMNMKNAAMTLYEADSALYGGANFCEIYHALLWKGLTDSFPEQLCRVINPSVTVNAGADKTICAGDSVSIGDASFFKSEYTYSWSPAAGLGSPLSLVTNAAPAQSTAYLLSAVAFNGSYNVDTANITVLQCDIQLLNTEGFKWGEDLIIKLPYNSDNNSIEVFDVHGKRVYRYAGLAEQSYTFSGNLLPAGAYVFRIKSETVKKEQKVVKVR